MADVFSVAGVAYLAAQQTKGAYDAAKSSARTNSQVHSLKSNIRMLEANVAKSLMINEALWEIIRDKLKMTEQDLHKKIHEVDMRDGKLDSKNQRKAIECPTCSHMVSSRHPACLYCGHIIDDSIFNMQ